MRSPLAWQHASRVGTTEPEEAVIMTAKTFDAIVVGARVAGAPTAMLLARKGYRVLLVDRATFPSDTMSTHLIHAPGMALLHGWGLADRVIATGCPPVTAYRLDLGPFAIAGAPRGTDVEAHAFAPRRTVLDAILVDAAAEAGADVRQGTSVDGLIVEDGVVRGSSTRPVRGLVRGTCPSGDRCGWGPLVRRALGRIPDDPRGPGARSAVLRLLECVPHRRGVPALPTGPTRVRRDPHERRPHGGGGHLAGRRVRGQSERSARQLPGRRSKRIRPSRSGRVQPGRETRLVGAKMQNFYRRSHGPGWALIGDAGYHKDAVTAQGMTDAFRDAELVSSALDDAFTGRRSQDEALAAWEQGRDASTRPMFDLTCQLASHEPPSDEEVELFAAIASHEDATRDFMSVLAGTMPVEAFFDPTNLERYVPEQRTPATAL